LEEDLTNFCSVISTNKKNDVKGKMIVGVNNNYIVHWGFIVGVNNNYIVHWGLIVGFSWTVKRWDVLS
jgi:hypothetical protein